MLCLFIPAHWVDTHLFTISIVKTLPEWHMFGIIHYIAFSDWLLWLGHMHLWFLHGVFVFHFFVLFLFYLCVYVVFVFGSILLNIIFLGSSHVVVCTCGSFLLPTSLLLYEHIFISFVCISRSGNSESEDKCNFIGNCCRVLQIHFTF